MSEPETSAQIIKLTPPHLTADPEWCVTTLENVGGNLKRFISALPDKYALSDEQLLAKLERWLVNLDEKSFYRRWTTAIAQNAAVRLRLQQARALDMLEGMFFEKTTEELAFIRLVLAANKPSAPAKKKLFGSDAIEGESEEDEDDIIEGIIANA